MAPPLGHPNKKKLSALDPTTRGSAPEPRPRPPTVLPAPNLPLHHCSLMMIHPLQLVAYTLVLYCIFVYKYLRVY